MKEKRMYRCAMSNSKRKWLKSFIGFSLTLIMFSVNILGSMNMVAQAATTPLAYYQKTEKEYLNKLIDGLTNTYKDYITTYQESLEKEIGLETTIKAAITPSMTDGTPFEGLRSIEAAMLTMQKEKESKTDIVISANDQALVSMGTYTNLDNLIYILIPELSDALLKIDAKDLDEYATSTAFVDYMSNPISDELLNKLLKKYGAIIIDNIKNVTAQDDIYVDINNVISKHTKLTININELDILDIANAILNEAKNDKELKTIFIDLGICSEAEYDSVITEGLITTSTQQELLRDYGSDSYKILKMYLWVNNKGDVAGRSISFDLFGEIITLGYRTTQFGNKMGVEAWLILNHEDIVRGKGIITANLSGLSGNFDISVTDLYSDEQSVININFENIKYSKENINNYMNKFINGKFTISSKDMGTSINIELFGDGGKQEIIFDISENNVSLINISSTLKEVPYKEYKGISSSDKVYDFVTEFNDYMENANIKGFLEGIKEKSDLDIIDYYIDSILEVYDMN